MRYQGKLINWKDDQGFGFVIPNGGGEKAFVHIKAFTERSKRPENGDLINYELSKDNKGRQTAKNIQMVNAQAVNKSSKNSVWLELILITLLISILLISAYFNKLPIKISIWYLTVSLITFAIYGKDKLAAKFDYWRTSENTLHILSIIGGWPGAMVAHKLLRHKSKKEEFRFTFWVTVIVNFISLLWLLTSYAGIH
jgi:uncharacterized membrane protein YsdA (DUF1294 family)/cold shock CspA family protein